MDPIKSGFVARNFVWGIVLVLLAMASVIAGNNVRFPIEIRGFVIPSWPVYPIAILLFMIGIVLIAGAGRGDRCASCGKTLRIMKARFALRDGDKVVHSIRELDAGMLRDLRDIKEGEPVITLFLDYCHACRRVAKIEVRKEDGRKSSDLVPERIVTGAPVWKFIDAIERLREMGKKEKVEEKK
jgi:hypothetical protein